MKINVHNSTLEKQLKTIVMIDLILIFILSVRSDLSSSYVGIFLPLLCE